MSFNYISLIKNPFIWLAKEPKLLLPIIIAYGIGILGAFFLFLPSMIAISLVEKSTFAFFIVIPLIFIFIIIGLIGFFYLIAWVKSMQYAGAQLVSENKKVSLHEMSKLAKPHNKDMLSIIILIFFLILLIFLISIPLSILLVITIIGIPILIIGSIGFFFFLGLLLFYIYPFAYTQKIKGKTALNKTIDFIKENPLETIVSFLIVGALISVIKIPMYLFQFLLEFINETFLIPYIIIVFILSIFISTLSTLFAYNVVNQLKK